MDFFPEIDVSSAAAEAIARGLFAVARAEGGVHEREAALIRAFHGEVVGGSAQSLAALENAPDIAHDALALALPAPELRRLFVKTALLVAWADNQVGEAERAVLAGYAAALDVTPDDVDQLEQSVKEYLLGQLVHLTNVDATTEVAKKLAI